MHSRDSLGTADVTDQQLTEMVASLFDQEPTLVEILDSTAEEVAYDLPAITTGGRYWVRGSALIDGRREPFSFFVKQVQEWSRSPLFAAVPPEMAAAAAASVPWRTEPLAYRSDLGDRLPAGLSMPRALGVFDLDDKSAAMWLETVDVEDADWDSARYARAAFLLGRLAASPKVHERAGVGEFAWTVRDYRHGRLAQQVLPMLRDPGIWHHPLVAGAFDDALRQRLLAAADRVDDLVDELCDLPIGTAHGDACPNNLLVTAEADSFVLIDYGFWSPAPLGFDLGQLLVGDVQIGKRAAASLLAIEDVIVASYVEGLRAEGCEVPKAVVRRAHALHLLVFTGLSTLPFEHLADQVTPALSRIAQERAAIARFSLDLLDATESQ